MNAALASLLFFAASPLARHWLMGLVSTVCILGGIVAAPIVSMVAWIGLVLPTHAPLHRLAPVLVATSLIWFCMAIVGSHALRLESLRLESLRLESLRLESLRLESLRLESLRLEPRRHSETSAVDGSQSAKRN